MQNSFTGAINGENVGTISVRDIKEYVYKQTDKKAVIKNSDKARYNGESGNSINTELANKLEYFFTPLNSWIYDLLDSYISKIELG